ncbi:ABC transporter permease subunit [Acuticoccus sp. M5D2P5]|uniref:amino acid ABC transporter permease n=1 Tax=Acuticoccus kalidii TaxID=2910977 RepID=UPI001F1C38CB|nr:ABC transporter permease subunit [Acuticoccus kalidii]MCF3936546.1 ABC transporter permease subunit [Acuticoccus kalidii]
MSVVTNPDAPTFRLDMLWRDERYRSGFIQAITMIILMLVVAWLVNNTVQNLAALGKDFNFSFLWQPAGYDINQQLIPYRSTDSNARAALVGIINTLVVAGLGCITATVLGIIAGVARLSKNWLIAKLMTVYVEGFRNVPVLLWILLTATVVNESLPAPRAFRDLETGAVVATNRGIYIPRPLFESGWLVLLIIAALSIAGAVLFSRYTKRHQEATGSQLPELGNAVRWIIAGTVGLISGVVIANVLFTLLSFTPLEEGNTIIVALGSAASLVLALAVVRWAANAQVAGLMIIILVVPTVVFYFLLGRPITLEYPTLQGFNFQGGIQLRDSLIALWLALSLYTGAFIAEIVRAGILSVSHGQSEAAFALGLRPNRTMKLVILPQALRVIVPPLISQFLNLTKNSSLAIAVGYMDATGTLGGITLNQTGREMECILLLMGFYLVLSLLISLVMNIYNSHVRLVER